MKAGPSLKDVCFVVLALQKLTQCPKMQLNGRVYGDSLGKSSWAEWPIKFFNGKFQSIPSTWSDVRAAKAIINDSGLFQNKLASTGKPAQSLAKALREIADFVLKTPGVMSTNKEE